MISLSRFWKRRGVRLLAYTAVVLFLLYHGALFTLEHTICRGGHWEGPVSDHFDGRRFHNTEPEPERSSWAFVLWGFMREPRPYPDVAVNADRPELAEEVNAGEWEATLVNHSTWLLRFKGVNVLTDPVWSERVSPVSFAGPKRHRPAGIEFDRLPKIDAVVLSHDHYDHLDFETLKRLNERFSPQFYAPLGVKSLLESAGIENVIELDWWEDSVYAGEKGSVRLTLTPARHYSARFRTESARNRTLWGGYYFRTEDGASVYFAGDTTWTKYFAEIAERLGSPGLAILTVGAYQPLELIGPSHLTPAQAVKAHKVLQAGMSVGGHFGTWQLADDGYQEALDDLRQALKDEGVDTGRFLAPNNGKTIRSGRRD